MTQYHNDLIKALKIIGYIGKYLENKNNTNKGNKNRSLNKKIKAKKLTYLLIHILQYTT